MWSRSNPAQGDLPVALRMPRHDAGVPPDMNAPEALRQYQTMGDKRATPVDVVLGQNIRMYRMRRGLTQMELGRWAGVAYQQIQKYETGENRVSSGRLTQIALVLGVPIPMLLEDSPVGTAGDDHSARALLAKRHSVRLVLAFDRVRHEPMRLAILELIEAIGKTSRRRR